MSELITGNKDVKELQNIYNEITKEGIIGGSSQLEDFANKCLELGKKHDELKTPTFVLYAIFKEISNNQYQRPVPAKECEDIYKALNPMMQNLFEDMEIGTYMKTLNQIINDFENLFNK